MDTTAFKSVTRRKKAEHFKIIKKPIIATQKMLKYMIQGSIKDFLIY